jgi:ATP-binding cassette subfamily B protein
MIKDRKARDVFAYYWKQARAYPSYLTGVIVCLPITILLNTYIPALIVANVLSRLSQHDYKPHDVLGSFGPQLAVFIASLLLGMVMWRVVDSFAWGLEMRICKKMVEDVLDHMLEESTDFHANNFTGTLVSRTNKLVGGYTRIADTTIYFTYQLIAGIVFSAVILFPRAPIVAILLAILSLVFIFISLKVSRPVREHSAKTADAESHQTGYLADAITNVIAIKSFSRGDYERKRFQKATANTRAHMAEFAIAHKKQMNILGALTRSLSLTALLLGIISVMVLKVNIATVFLIVSFAGGLADQLFGFGNTALRNYSRGIGDAWDMVNILSQTATVLDPKDPEASRIKDGLVEFKNVRFDHDNDGEGSKSFLFHNFNLEIKPGEKIGLVGHSGGGKTTLTRLILHFMNLHDGEILIDGQNIANITQDDLRRSITYVPQEPLLFHRTLEENINYGKPTASKNEVIAISKMAHAHEFIKDLPKGYETLVGERGIKLSGGQRQRVAIARAMLKEAPILVLDEATSALDSESEKLIQEALWKLMEDKTAIVIAHRLSTIQRMDRIVVLEEGKIAEQGTHKELLEHKGVYASLWAHQSGGFLED